MPASEPQKGTYRTPFQTDRDRLRFLVWDTNSEGTGDWLLADTEYDSALSMFSFSDALIYICNALLSLYAQSPDVYEEDASGGVKLQWKNRFERWIKMIEDAQNGDIPIVPGAGVFRSSFSAGVIIKPDTTNMRTT